MKNLVNHKLKVDVYRIMLEDLLLAKKSVNYEAEDRRHVVDCVQWVFQQSFYQASKLRAFEILRFMGLTIMDYEN